jgi:ABC-type branched-subunit amino acid transport system substrate-binding protein
MRVLRRVATALALASLVGVVVATAATARSGRVNSSGVAVATSKTINLKIGEVVPLTGPLASFGPSFYKAGQMAVSVSNQAAKAAGYPMHITVSQGDEGTGPTSAVSAARQLAAGGINCLIGGISTGDSVAMAQAVTIPGKLTQISPTASSAVYDTVHSKGHLTFRTSQTDAFQTLVLAHFMAQQLHGAKGKLVAVGGRNDSYGGPATADFVSAWKKLGGLVTGPILYDPNATSYDSEAAQLVAGNPVAFVIEDFPETYAKVGAALLRTGKFSANNLYTTSGFPAQIPAGTPPEALNGAWVVQPGQPTSGPVIKAYNKLYAGFHASPKAQQPFNTNNFDATLLCILASAAAHSSSGPAIAKKVIAVSGPPGKAYSFLQLKAAFAALKAGKDIDFQGVSGSLDLNSLGDPGGGLVNVNRYQNSNLTLLRQVNFVGGKLLPVK